MVTVLGECTTEEQHSVVHFLWVKGLNERIFIKKRFLFMVGSVCHTRRFTTGLRNSLKDVQKPQMMSHQVALLRLQQKQPQSKDFNAVGFDALVNRWEKSINVGGGSIEK
jgi:hypothetical protein